MSAAAAAAIRARRRTSWSQSASAPASTARRSREPSRLVAKVDSAAVQDGFDLYLHGFIVTDDGQWVVVQQGMNGESKLARRYHWSSQELKSFVETPHAAIDGENQGEIVNLTDARARRSREGQLELLQDFGPDRIVHELALLRGQQPAPIDTAPMLPHLVMPEHHDVRPKDVILRRLHGALAAAADAGPGRLRRAAAGAGRRRAHGPFAGAGVGGGARRAAPLRRSGALLAGAWRQGPPSLSGAGQGAGRDDRRAEVGARAAPSSATTRSSTPSAASTARRGSSRPRRPARRSAPSRRRSGGARSSMVGAACSAGNRRRPRTRRKPHSAGRAALECRAPGKDARLPPPSCGWRRGACRPVPRRRRSPGG